MRFFRDAILIVARDVAPDDNHAADAAVVFPIQAGVAQHGGDDTGFIADSQRNVDPKALGIDLPAEIAGLLGLGEVIGEVRADQFPGGPPSDQFAGSINVGDPAIGVDRDQRIENCLDQMASIP